MTDRTHILIVDDDASLRKILSDILRAKGYVPLAAGTGKAALASIEEQKAAVVLIDLKLEDMSGLELMERIKKHSPVTECIVLTGHASQSSAIEAVNLGAYSYLQKPYDMEQLLVTIRRSIEKQEAEQALRTSEASYRAIFNSVNDAILVLDVDTGSILDGNRKMCEMYGYTLEEARHLFFGALSAGESPYAHQDVLKQIEQSSGGEPQLFEWQAKSKTGRLFWVEVNLKRATLGDKARLLAIVRDITERKRADEERIILLTRIREQAERMLEILNTVPEGVLLLDADGWVILANPIAVKDLSVLAGVRVGDTLTHLGDRPLAELLASPPKGLWHEVTTGDRVFEIVARSVKAGPTPGGWVMVIRDVTREREIQQRVQQQDRLASVGQLAAGIAHDFNNIMAIIVLYTQIALSATPDLSPKSRNRLMTVTQQARRASDLIQQILDFSRSAMIERQSLNLVLLLKEQVKLLARTLPENIQIDLTYGPTLLPGEAGPGAVAQTDEYMVSADPTRMQQVVMNLALNARDAMPGGGELQIGLRRLQIQPGGMPPLPDMEAEHEAWIQLTVADSGIGIPSDVLPHIFDPFFTTKAPGQGTGLGLAQVYGIVKQHEGEIDVKSRIGHGTTFTIYLPALPTHQSGVVTTEAPTLVQGAGETILVVEDDVATREALLDTLETMNYRAVGAANGREALEILERQVGPSSEDSAIGEVALVLSDVVMPEMGGIPLVHALREKHPEIQVVLLTGHMVDQELESLRAQGLCNWLSKPPNLEQLALVMAQALAEEPTR